MSASWAVARCRLSSVVRGISWCSGIAAVARLFDPREQEDAVVGGEAEDDREEQQQLGRFEPTLAGVCRLDKRNSRFAGISSSLTDSNRRPPPYHTLPLRSILCCLA